MPTQQTPAFQIEPLGGTDLLLDRVADAIRQSILTGELPPGARLSVPELARQLNVSRTPAREALMRLEHEGLITLTPRRGAVVLSGESGELEEIFQYREALEGMAARLATRRISPGDLEVLRSEFDVHAEAVRAGNLGEHVHHDWKFHDLIAQASGNRRIADELVRVRSQLQLLTRTMSSERGAMDDRIIDAHREVLVAIEAKDGRRAESAARAHIRAVLNFYRGLGLVPTVSHDSASEE